MVCDDPRARLLLVAFQPVARRVILRAMRRGPVWLLAVLVAGATASCTNANSDAPGPTITSTYQPHSHPTTPTNPPPISTGANVRPGEKPPSLSSVGKTNTPAGALAFSDYWTRTLDWGYATTDSALAKSAFAEVCTGCARFVKIFDNARANGVHFRGGRSNVISSELQPNDHHNGATAVDDISISIGALQAVDANGQVVETNPEHPRVVYRVWLQWKATSWKVVDTRQGVEQ
jgi:hypothetical protein